MPSPPRRWARALPLPATRGTGSLGGNLSIRRIRDDKRTGTTIDARELRSVETRLRHMDEMGVDVHVMYPTMFLTYLTSDPTGPDRHLQELQPLEWPTDPLRAADASGGWRWLPMLDVEAAVDELRWASEHGACGVFKLATEIGRRVTDPYFFPVYQEANDLGLPLCMHTGSGDPPVGSSAQLLGDGITGTTTSWTRSTPSSSPASRSGVPQAAVRLHRGGLVLDPVRGRQALRATESAWPGHYGSFTPTRTT